MIPDRKSLGKKHVCECGCKFYDLGKDVPVCPRCGRVFERDESQPSPDSVLFVDESGVDELTDIEFEEEALEEEEGGVKIVSISEVEKEEDEEGDEYE